MTKNRYPNGKGPWYFSNDSAIAPGEKFTLDLRNMKYNGQNGYFKKFLPLDFLQVTNLDTSNGIEVDLSGIDKGYVTPSGNESFSGQPYENVTVTNLGSTQIDIGDIKLQLELTPYDANDRARQVESKGWLERAMDDLIPGGVPNGD